MLEAFAPRKAGSAAAHLMDADSRNLRRNASGHGAVVMDTDLISDTEMAGLVAVHQYLLLRFMVADQKLTAFCAADCGTHMHSDGILFHSCFTS